MARGARRKRAHARGRVLVARRSERAYCHDYFLLVGGHLKSTVLNQLPPDFDMLVRALCT